MGRAMLLLVSGLIIVFGVIQMSLNAKQQAMAEFNVEYANSLVARNTSNAGMEQAIHRIMEDPDWRTGANAWDLRLGDWTVSITTDDASTDASMAANQVRITATCVVGGVTERSIALLQMGEGLPIPEVEGAMGIFTENLDLSVSGSAFLITGNDTDPDGGAGSGVSLPGMSVSSLAAYNEILSSLNATQQTKVQGAGGPPAVQLDPTMDATALQTFFDAIIANPDEYYAGNHTATGVGSLGTPEDPKIIVVDGILDVQNATGAGILVITETGQLDARGNFDNYQGLILIQGSADMTRGNINIYGAMMFGGDNPSLQIDIDFRGNVNIHYSSQALDVAQTLANTGAGGVASNFTLLSIYD
jgi:hypothetical protein